MVLYQKYIYNAEEFYITDDRRDIDSDSGGYPASNNPFSYQSPVPANDNFLALLYTANMIRLNFDTKFGILRSINSTNGRFSA